MSKEARQPVNTRFSGWLFLLIVLLLVSVLCLGLFLFNMGQLNEGSTFFPVSLRSVLSANYNADAQTFNVGVVDLGLIESALSDQGSPGPSLPGLILTSVPTITPYTPWPSPTHSGTVLPGTKTPSRPANTQTSIIGPGTPSPTQPGGTPLQTATPTVTITPSPTRSTLTVTPTPGGGRTPTPSSTQRVQPSNSPTRPGPTPTKTHQPPGPTATNTLIPATPTNTVIQPTATIVPTATSGGYPPPPVATSTSIPSTPSYP